MPETREQFEEYPIRRIHEYFDWEVEKQDTSPDAKESIVHKMARLECGHEVNMTSPHIKDEFAYCSLCWLGEELNA